MSSTPPSLRFAARGPLRQRGLASAVVLSLAVPLAAVIAVFAASAGLVLRALPFQEPDRLALPWLDNRPQSPPRVRFSWVDYEEWRDFDCSFGGLAAFHPALTTLTGGGEPELVRGASRCGIAAELCIGVRKYPLGARAWVEYAPRLRRSPAQTREVVGKRFGEPVVTRRSGGPIQRPRGQRIVARTPDPELRGEGDSSSLLARRLTSRLRAGEAPIVGRLHGDSLLLDLPGLDGGDLELISHRFARLSAAGGTARPEGSA